MTPAAPLYRYIYLKDEVSIGRDHAASAFGSVPEKKKTEQIDNLKKKN
jgi:hypothetical protein